MADRIVYGKAVIPPGTRSVPNYAFFWCSSLVSVTIPASVTSIGLDAFYYCTSLVSVEIPASVASIGLDAFYYCTSLVSVTIPASVTSIGDSAFRQCSSLVSVTISASVTSVGDLAFYQCSSLVSVEIPASVASIGSYAFSNCTSLVSVTIPASVTSIGDAFHNCGCSASMYVAGATVCDCAASPTWPCTPQQLPACAGRDLAACSVYSDHGVGMCCELEVHDCVCVAQGTVAEIAGICGGLKNGGIDCDQCKASPRCSGPQLGLADE